MPQQRDCWSEWLTERRYGGDEEQRRAGFEQLRGWRDRVLDNATLDESDTVLDVGCGEGLLGFGALDRGVAAVIFSDISADALGICREAAAALDVADRCRFIHASAEDLRPIDQESTDVVLTRAVLIYVADKARAFSEFRRVLGPGGRLSMLEPINRFARRDADTWAGYDVSSIPDIARKVRAVYETLQPLDTDPMLDFDERDLIVLAERAGFFPISLQLDAEIRAIDPRRWDTFLDTAGNPRIPTIREVMEDVLTPVEQDAFTAHLRPLVEEGRGTWRMASAYLQAVKPASPGLH